MAAKPAFKWLAANAPRFGFEMSFPISNRQNVKWEPWHWRWVGTAATLPGAARARFLFRRARADFPANPVIDPPAPKAPVSQILITLPEPTYGVGKEQGKEKRRRKRGDRAD